MLCHVLRDCWIEVKDFKSLYASQVKVMPVFVPHCISPTRIAEGMLQVIASVCVPSSCATHSNLACDHSACAQGAFGCALRIKSESGDKAFVVKVLSITEKSYTWIMREILFGYHLSTFNHPNIARLLHHYVSPNTFFANNDFSAGSCVYFVQDDCGKSLMQ